MSSRPAAVKHRLDATSAYTALILSFAGVFISSICWMSLIRARALDRYHQVQPRRQLETKTGFLPLASPECMEVGPILMPGGSSLFILQSTANKRPSLVNESDVFCVSRLGELEVLTQLPTFMKDAVSNTAYIVCEGTLTPPRARSLPSLSGLPCNQVYLPSASWNDLVYKAEIFEQDVVVWAKGPHFSHRAKPGDTCNMSCTFYQPQSLKRAETEASSCTQEVVICPAPTSLFAKNISHPSLWHVSLKLGTSVLASGAVLDMTGRRTKEKTSQGLLEKKNHGFKKNHQKRKFLCACTMIYNAGPFVKEWVLYHWELGVEHFFFYDNDSDDNTADTMKGLETAGISLTRMLWPWPKTQQGGFSHCALAAKSRCTWMIFADVDEFIYPTRMLRTPSHKPKAKDRSPRPRTTPLSDVSKATLRRLITSEVMNQEVKYLTQKPGGAARSACRRVGQLSVPCLVFGPSGQEKVPSEGVTLGYRCRLGLPERHKAIVLLDALVPPYTSMVHHFTTFAHGFCNINLGVSTAAFFHYKYQAWDVFRSKFHRRVATYVADWKEPRGLNSQDRAPGLGTSEEKPQDWESRFCEVNDTRMIVLVYRLFDDQGPQGVVLQTSSLRLPSDGRQ